MTTYGARFWRMYGSSATSNLADGIGRTGIPLLAATYTRDPVAISGLISFTFLPWLLFALPSGALIDRTDRRYAMAAANIARSIAAAALCILVLTHSGSIGALYVVAFALGTAETVYDSATRALLPHVVDTTKLDGANGLLTIEENLGQTFLGAPLGSALFTLATVAPFAVNAGGFFIAAVLILTLRGDFRPQRTTRTSLRHEIAEGVHWLRHHELLRGLTLISAATGFIQTMSSGVLVLYVLEVLHLPPGDFGFVLLGAGVGALIGGAATPLLGKRFGRPIMLTIGATLSAVALGLMAFTSNGYVAAALFALCSAGVMVWNVLTMSLRQALIPAELFGRVQGAYRTLVWGAIPLGSLAGGALASATSLRTVFAVAGAGLLGMAVLLGRLVHRHRSLLEDAPTAELVAA